MRSSTKNKQTNKCMVCVYRFIERKKIEFKFNHHEMKKNIKVAVLDDMNMLAIEK